MADDDADHDDQHEEAEILLQHDSVSAACMSCRPTASCITFLAELGALEQAGDLALVHHRHAVADADHLLHVAGDHQDRDAGSASSRISR